MSTAWELFRDRFDIGQGRRAENLPFFKPEPNSAETRYLSERRTAGQFRATTPRQELQHPTPPLDTLKAIWTARATIEISTTTLALLRDPRAGAVRQEIGSRIVPVIPDEARHAGMEGMFRRWASTPPSASSAGQSIKTG